MLEVSSNNQVQEASSNKLSLILHHAKPKYFTSPLVHYPSRLCKKHACPSPLEHLLDYINRSWHSQLQHHWAPFQTRSIQQSNKANIHYKHDQHNLYNTRVVEKRKVLSDLLKKVLRLTWWSFIWSLYPVVAFQPYLEQTFIHLEHINTWIFGYGVLALPRW